MSAQLIARSPDLSRLREEGYEVDIREDHVVVTNVPYVTADQQVERGMFAVSLTTSGDGSAPEPTSNCTSATSTTSSRVPEARSPRLIPRRTTRTRIRTCGPA